MQRWSVVPGIVVLLIVSGILPVFGDDQTQPSTDANRVWRFHDGQWTEETTLPATAPADEPMLDRAEVLLQKGDPHDARKTLLAWEKVNKDNPSRDRCIFLLAQAFYQSDDRIKSFYYCDELMDEYPQSSLFQAALQKQYDIADAYLSGYKELFLFFRIGDRSPEAVQMMFRIQQRAPGSKLAERALIRTADYYYASQQYDLAEDAYNTYIRGYPRSPEIPRVRLRAAFASLAQYHGVPYDATDIIDARAQLVSIEKDYPDMAEEESVPTVIDQIDSAFAKKLLELAEYYERVHQPKGAVFNYRFLTQTYPASPEAQVARDRLNQMPAEYLDEAPPVPSAGYSPATQPTANAEVP